MDTMMARSEEDFEKTDVTINQENVKFILMDGYEYSFVRMLGDTQKWKCTNKSCYAYFKIMDQKLFPGVMVHSHERQGGFSLASSDTNGLKRKTEFGGDQNAGPAGGSIAKPEEDYAKRYPMVPKGDPLRCFDNLPDNPSTQEPARKVKLASGKTVVRRRVPPKPKGNVGSKPSSLPTVLTSAVAPSTYSPAGSPILSQMGPSPMGPPPTPPRSRRSSTSSQPGSGTPSPCPPVIDLVDSDVNVSYPMSPSPNSMESQPSISGLNLRVQSKIRNNSSSPQLSPQPSASFSKQLSGSRPSAKRSTTSSATRDCEDPHIKMAKFKEFEDMFVHLENENFGSAVASLLSSLPKKPAEEVRYEIATLLYEVVQEYSKKKENQIPR